MATPAESSSLSPKARAAMQACRARTGFDSYNAYLHFHNVTTWALDAICGPLRPLTEPRVEPLDTNRELRQEDSFVLNVSKDWELSVDPHCDESGTDIIEAISHRPENARLQIILWNIQRTDLSRSRESLVDFIGLRFGLDPHIFRALGAFPRPWDFYGILDRYKRTYVKIGSHIATVCHSKDDNNEKPVMLIAGIPNYRLGDQLDPCPPFDHSSSSDKQLDSMRITGYYSFYLQALNSFLERYKTHQADPNDLLLLGLLPLLQVFLLGTRVECAYLQAELNVSGTPDYTTPNRKQPILDRNRANVRRCIVDMEDGWSSVVTYTRLRFGWNASRRAISQDFEEDEMKPIADEAKRWESAGRDHLQLEVSKASLEESKKSIEVSNQQIAEGKRGRSQVTEIISFYRTDLSLQ
ncbi:MAG: hypothetical protein LQ346_006022 [Caloplaca aetnensis]|nr:MAG: hypothetical protein LQ346_006022 [Caloplaca aetnensis]